jgi:hypothetical protein
VIEITTFRLKDVLMFAVVKTSVFCGSDYKFFRK